MPSPDTHSANISRRRSPIQPGHDHTGKAAHRSTESRLVYNASRNENDDPPDCLRLARQLVKTDRHLASALALAHERDLAWAEQRRQMQEGRATFSQPVTSPVQVSLLPNVSAPGEEQCEQHDLSDASSRYNAVEAIPNPPIPGDPAPSVDAIFARVNSFAKTRGFSIIKAHSMIRPGQRSRYVLQCDRYGAPRPGRDAGIRKRKSRKTGCLWKIIAEALPENGFQWTLQHFPDAEHHHHNHNPSTDAAAHPVHRRLTSPVKATIQSSSRRVAIRARDIGGIVRDHFSDSVYTKRDIYNARTRISRENLGGYSSAAALIKLFDGKEVPYVAEWAKDEPDRLVGLVWTFPYYIQMWRRFPEVISFDNTCNTNRFKLPLFQVTGQTCLGTVFNAAFGLIDNERLEGSQFLTNGVRTLLDRYSTRTPDVVITDFDDQMKKALGVEFQDAQTGEESSSDELDAALSQRDRQAVQASGRQEEPITHDNLSRLITHDYHRVLMLWRLVVFTETEEDHEKAWECLCTQFGDQKAILAYLYEASNNNIKSYLLNGMSHLYRLVEAIQVGCGSEYLGELPRMVSQKALSLITREHRKALKGIPAAANPRPDAIVSCNDDCTVRFLLLSLLPISPSGARRCAHSHSPSQIVGSGLDFRAFDIQEGVLEVSAELRGMLAESDIPTSSTD
ncbi:hypothetical protein FPOA_12003 [Fusarium poae]|uniref:MULE transposase domain-containing protein n=1 Tax=Fusarium poae TaxID=36050 RepID=A0A1B8A9L6_FUSPO|nr:hypothetical protein FPOA_12318 [Fusarium poae]OBS17510.1 hypothetical protein FPOA_12003 [Fusarium poae]